MLDVSKPLNEAKPLVRLDELQRALACNPKACIRGLGLQSYRRCNVQPKGDGAGDGTRDSACDDASAHGSTTPHKHGRILELTLGPEPSDQEVVQALHKEPGDLLIGLNIQRGIGGSRLVRRLRVECGAELSIELKLYDDGGQPTLYYDQVPELLEPNATNLEWWLERELRQCTTCKAAQAILVKLQERELSASIYSIGGKDWRRFVSEAKARQWLPKLPDDFAMLVDKNGAFELPRDQLFALFGSAETYLEAIQT